MADVLITQEAARQIDALPPAVRLLIDAVVTRLEKWPNVSGAKPLRHDLRRRYRIRTRDYRVQFYVVGDRVVVEKVGHRDRFYEE